MNSRNGREADIAEASPLCPVLARLDGAEGGLSRRKQTFRGREHLRDMWRAFELLTASRW